MSEQAIEAGFSQACMHALFLGIFLLLNIVPFFWFVRSFLFRYPSEFLQACSLYWPCLLGLILGGGMDGGGNRERSNEDFEVHLFVPCDFEMRDVIVKGK